MKKVGSITTATGLVGLGLLLLVQQIYPQQAWAAHPLQWWPLLLIGLGLEILYRRAVQKDTEMKLDWLILVFLAAIFGAGLYGQAQVQIMDYGIFGWKYTLTGSYEVKDSVSGIQSLEIRPPEGKIILMPATNGEFRVRTDLTVRSNREEVLPKSFLKMSREGNRLLVTCEDSSGGLIRGKKETVTRIELPAGIPARVEGRSGELTGQGIDNPLVVDQEFGDIDLSHLGGPLTVRSDSAEVRLREIRGQTLIRLNDGQVKAEQVSGLQAALDSGDISIIEGNGIIDVSSQTGSITLDNPQGLDGDCRLHTETGTIDFFAGQLANCHLTASSGAGEVAAPSYLEKPEYRKDADSGQTLEATLGQPEKIIDLFARQGSVTVR